MHVKHERCDDAGHPSGWTRAVRTDVGRLARAERTAAGGVRVRGAIAHAGVLTYQRADGTTVRELLPPEELGAADSLASLRDAPITVGHPAPSATGSQLVTPETYRRLSVGHVSGDPVVESEHAITTLAVLDGETIARIDSGELVELSPGYQCLIDPTPGTWRGEPYDQIQRRRTYNHVALLPEGGARGGSTVALRVDGIDDYAAQVRADAKTTPAPRRQERTDEMEHERIDGVTYKVGSPEWREAIGRKMARLDEENAKLEEEKKDAEEEKEKADADLEAMKAERDALKAKVAELEAQIAELESPEQLDARADARASLIDKARRVLGREAKLERTDDKSGKARRMTDREIKLAVLAKIAPDVDPAKVTDAYIDARFDAHMAMLASSPSDALSSARANAFGPPPATRADGHSELVNEHTVGREPPPSLGDAWRRG